MKPAAHDQRGLDPEPDHLLFLISLMRQHFPEVTDERAAQFEATVRAELGGLRVRIPKNKKHPTPEQRHAIAAEALACDQTDDQLIQRHGISRRSLYYYVKRYG